jgi:hypothetical protein
MMKAKEILDDQVIHVKRGRTNGLGFEPAFNSYFDFYLNSKYFGEPLLEMEDVTLHLYLRKNLNDHNKAWKMPTIRQMMAKFGISQKKLMAMIKRLEQAHLLVKESGMRVGTVNARNNYILSDPIPTLEEFLEVAAEGLFRLPLVPGFAITPAPIQPIAIEPPCITEQYIDVSPSNTYPCITEQYDQQTLNTKQTSGRTVDTRWQAVLDDFEISLPAKTFERFVSDSTLLEIVDGVAVVGTPQAYARDWIENRLSDRLKRALGVASVRCVVVEQ